MTLLSLREATWYTSLTNKLQLLVFSPIFQLLWKRGPFSLPTGYQPLLPGCSKSLHSCLNYFPCYLFLKIVPTYQLLLIFPHTFLYHFHNFQNFSQPPIPLHLRLWLFLSPPTTKLLEKDAYDFSSLFSIVYALNVCNLTLALNTRVKQLLPRLQIRFVTPHPIYILLVLCNSTSQQRLALCPACIFFFHVPLLSFDILCNSLSEHHVDASPPFFPTVFAVTKILSPLVIHSVAPCFDGSLYALTNASSCVLAQITSWTSDLHTSTYMSSSTWKSLGSQAPQE